MKRVFLRFNEALRLVESGQNIKITSIIPNFEQCDQTFIISLLVTNLSEFQTSMDIKRKKVCDCELVEVSKGISFRSKVYDCIHRKMLKMEIEESEQHFQVDVTVMLG